MKQFDSVVEKDPLKLKNYEANMSQVTSRTLYIFLFGVPVCLVLSMLFYFLASLASGDVELGKDSKP